MFVKSFCWLHVVVVELQDVPEEEEVLELSSLLHDVMKKVNTIKITIFFFLRIPYFLYKLVIKKID